MDPKKVAAVMEWEVPQNLKELRGFLGLCNYFRKFICGYSSIAAPLVDLTQKSVIWDANTWKEPQQQTFDRLKKCLSEAPVLRMPDFSLPFRLVSDASILGTGAVLLQEERPVAYCSAKYIPAEINYSTTEQELLGIIKALKEFRPYLEGGQHPVQLVTDHHPNTYLRTQPNLSRRQAGWSEYLERFNYTWEYVPGRLNVADPFSRAPVGFCSDPTIARIHVALHTHQHGAVFNEPGPSSHAQGDVPTVSVCQAGPARAFSMDINISQLLVHMAPEKGSEAEEEDLLEFFRKGYEADAVDYATMPDAHLYHQSDEGLWLRGTDPLHQKVVVPNSDDAKSWILSSMHDTPAAGHPGPERMLHLTRRWFWWKGMRQDVIDYAKSCKSCEMNKPNNQRAAGLLKSLDIPEYPFQSVSMDFITKLPVTAAGHDTIIVYVCRLTKFVTVVACNETLSAEDFYRFTVDHLISKHGCPESFVSDRDGRFISHFWDTMVDLMQSKKHMSTSFHPQTDGQTERMNRALEETLRHFVCYNQGDWDSHLQMAAFAINNSYHASTQTTPFMLTKGYHPRMPDPVTALTDRIQKQKPISHTAVKFSMAMHADIKFARECMRVAQEKQRRYADQHRRELSFEVGDMLLLSTKNLTLKNDQGTVARAKLLPKFIGPYEVIRKVGSVAYELALPDVCRIHPVFHVSLLKKFIEPSRLNKCRHFPQPLDWLDGVPQFKVRAILDHRVTFVGRKRSVAYLVSWKGFEEKYDSWEPEEMLLECEGPVLQRYLTVNSVATVFDEADPRCVRVVYEPIAPKPGRPRGKRGAQFSSRGGSLGDEAGVVPLPEDELEGETPQRREQTAMPPPVVRTDDAQAQAGVTPDAGPDVVLDCTARVRDIQPPVVVNVTPPVAPVRPPVASRKSPVKAARTSGTKETASGARTTQKASQVKKAAGKVKDSERARPPRWEEPAVRQVPAPVRRRLLSPPRAEHRPVRPETSFMHEDTRRSHMPVAEPDLRRGARARATPGHLDAYMRMLQTSDFDANQWMRGPGMMVPVMPADARMEGNVMPVQRMDMDVVGPGARIAVPFVQPGARMDSSVSGGSYGPRDEQRAVYYMPPVQQSQAMVPMSSQQQLVWMPARTLQQQELSRSSMPWDRAGTSDGAWVWRER